MNAKYAKLTPFGVRKLYKMPADVQLTEEEYAAQLGFKRLIENEKPQEGYWVHRWSETDTEVVLSWVETEPPEPEPWEISYSRGNDENDLTTTE